MGCKDCDKRKPGCHSKCESYLKEKAERDKLKEKMSESHEFNNYTFDRDKTMRRDHYQSHVFKSKRK